MMQYNSQQLPQAHQQWWTPEHYPSDSNVSEGGCGIEPVMQLTPPPQPANLPPSMFCPGCGIKAPMYGSTTCSRRCAWLVKHQCPQCGKNKPDGFVYCSRNCSYQSSQANWCSACGVCQTDLSGFCVNMDCLGAQQPTGSSNNTTPPPETGMLMVPGINGQPQPLPFSLSSATASSKNFSGPHQRNQGGNNNGISNRRNSNSRTECRVMNTSEVARSGIPSVFSAIVASGLGNRLVSVLKLTSSAINRKRYLSYRSIVENQMAGLGLAKYGHGGEGNEQRRYFGVSLVCSLGREAAPMAPVAIGAGGQSTLSGGDGSYDAIPSLRTCHDPACIACCVMNRGFDLGAMGMGSHYCNTTSTAAAQFLQPSPNSGLKALVVARVVIGNPEVHYVDASTEPPFIQPPQDPAFHHSLVLTNNDTNYDGTYIFSDEAVDPQYLVLFE